MKRTTALLGIVALVTGSLLASTAPASAGGRWSIDWKQCAPGTVPQIHFTTDSNGYVSLFGDPYASANVFYGDPLYTWYSSGEYYYTFGTEGVYWAFGASPGNVTWWEMYCVPWAR